MSRLGNLEHTRVEPIFLSYAHGTRYSPLRYCLPRSNTRKVPCHKTVTRQLFYYVYLRSSHLTLSPPAVNTPRRGPGEVIIFEETGIPCKKNSTWHAEVENRVLEFLKPEHKTRAQNSSTRTRALDFRLLHAKYYFFCTVFRFLRR